jgi:hypothetical protein
MSWSLNHPRQSLTAAATRHRNAHCHSVASLTGKAHHERGCWGAGVGYNPLQLSFLQEPIYKSCSLKSDCLLLHTLVLILEGTQ